jgi:hypothetical protein
MYDAGSVSPPEQLLPAGKWLEILITLLALVS